MAAAKRPLSNQESPERTAQRILQGAMYPAIRSLNCTFHGGVLTLDGTLPSFHLKQVAQTSVLGIEGVDRIDNRIEVAE